jgi:hypothetical protein
MIVSPCELVNRKQLAKQQMKHPHFTFIQAFGFEPRNDLRRGAWVEGLIAEAVEDTFDEKGELYAPIHSNGGLSIRSGIPVGLNLSWFAIILQSSIVVDVHEVLPPASRRNWI